MAKKMSDKKAEMAQAAAASVGDFVPLELTIQRAGIPQRVILRPSIHIEEIRTVPGEPIAGNGNAGTTVHMKGVPSERYAHRSGHLCPFSSVPGTILTRQEPPRQETSVTLQDQERDWDFLERHRDLVFDGRRIQMTDPAWDKVWALAEDIWTFRREIQKPGGNDFSRGCPWRHPVDTLVYGSWCLGGAYALVALCATLGLRARELSIWGHSVAEVHLDGQWCLVDSISRFPKNGGCNMVRASFAEVRLDPTNPKYGFCKEQQETYWESYNLAVRGFENGLWLQQIRDTVFTPQTAPALYPGWENPRFKSPYKDRYDLVWGQGGFGCPELILKQGQALQRRFWLGSLVETKALRAAFLGVDTGPLPSHHVPAGGGDWFIAVNGRVHGIRDQGGWQFHRESIDHGKAWRHEFEIQPAELLENAWNTLAIGCPVGSGNEFLCFGGAGEWSEPAEPIYCARL